MPTPTERRIIQQRHAERRGDILIPLLEDLLEKEVIPEDEDDFAFLDMLVRVRAVPRSKGVFSPSMLGSCVRQAYFSKRGEEKLLTISPQSNGYFLHGNFIHFKWQFALWKAHRAGLMELFYIDDQWGDKYGIRPAVEVRVVDGNWGGTIDAIVIIDGLTYIVDFKGINLIDFQRTVKSGAKAAYRRQIVGYAQIATKVLGIEIAGCLLVSECKAGPISGRSSPIALHETFVSPDAHVGDVARRLRTLRWFDHRDEVPPPECVSTQHMGFQECPYNRHCREEVKEIQRLREDRAKKRSGDFKVARTGR